MDQKNPLRLCQDAHAEMVMLQAEHSEKSLKRNSKAAAAVYHQVLSRSCPQKERRYEPMLMSM